MTTLNQGATAIHCLITGATGFIGGHIVRRALEDGHSCRAIVRPTSRTDALKEAGVECVVGALDDAAFLAEAFQGVQWFFHCAAKVGDWGRPDDYHQANVVPLPGVVDAAGQAGIERMIYLSSLGVYPLGNHRGTDETVLPQKSGDGYWDSKIDSEQIVLAAHRENGLPVTIVRPGYVYGPGDNHVLPRLLAKLKDGKVKYIGSGDQALSPIFVGSLVDIIFKAVETPAAVGQTYNVREPDRISKQDFIDTVADLAGYPRPTKHVPMAIAKPVAHILHAFGKLFRTKEAPLLNKNRLKFMGMDLDYSCRKVCEELEWQPRVAWRESLKLTIDWFGEQGRL